MEELFHIPFNKRHLIGNQRYSITGQPLLYLGLSLVDVLYELRQETNKLENIHFCSLVHSSDKELKVLDVTNTYPEFFTDCDILSDHQMDTTSFGADIKNGFYKFIFTQFCSFRRSRWSETGVFAEEYVIPQLLTEVLRENDFHGVLFSSTRVNPKVCYSKARFHVNRHRENLALFTKYNSSENIDRELFNQFICSKPITIQDKIDLTLEDLSTLQKQIGRLVNLPDATIPFPLDITEISGITTKVRFEELFINENGNEVKYFEHDIGKMHLQLVYQIVLELRNRMKNWL